jgi:hypothetical protein
VLKPGIGWRPVTHEVADSEPDPSFPEDDLVPSFTVFEDWSGGGGRCGAAQLDQVASPPRRRDGSAQPADLSDRRSKGGLV